jgi:ElaB/YqjD/DUF883 family membrane-anchored ribosome-binding protein
MANTKGRAHLEDLSKHSTEFRQKAAVLGHDVQELGRISKQVANDTMGLLGDNASGAYEEGMKKARQWEGVLEEKIRQKPVQSLLIAAGIGLFLGAVWKRR